MSQVTTLRHQGNLLICTSFTVEHMVSPCLIVLSYQKLWYYISENRKISAGVERNGLPRQAHHPRSSPCVYIFRDVVVPTDREIRHNPCNSLLRFNLQRLKRCGGGWWWTKLSHCRSATIAIEVCVSPTHVHYDKN